MNNNNSTGPRTNIGKQISSRNAIKHGCCSNETLILPAENIEDFQALEATWIQAYSPKDDLETHLLNQIIEADWFLQRANRTLAKVEAQIWIERPDPITWSDYQHQAIQRFTRYQTTRRNEFNKAKKALDNHRKLQATEKRSEERLVIYKEKNKPKPTFDELVAGMRRTAHALGLRSSPD